MVKKVQGLKRNRGKGGENQISYRCNGIVLSKAADRAGKETADARRDNRMMVGATRRNHMAYGRKRGRVAPTVRSALLPKERQWLARMRITADTHR